MSNTTNPFIALFAPALTEVLNEIQNAATSIAATPTIENVNTQLTTLEVEALNPTQLAPVSIAAAAQEASNLIASLQAHLNAVATAPTAAAVAS